MKIPKATPKTGTVKKNRKDFSYWIIPSIVQYLLPSDRFPHMSVVLSIHPLRALTNEYYFNIAVPVPENYQRIQGKPQDSRAAMIHSIMELQDLERISFSSFILGFFSFLANGSRNSTGLQNP